MTEELKWKDIESEIASDKNPKSVLLGNGFSMSWDSESFNQSNLKDAMEILNTVDGENVEDCIKKLKDSIDDSNMYSKEIKSIIDIKITADLIRILFKRLPQRINAEKSTPFVNFLKLFKNYFTLNYDSLLYFLLNKYKKEETKNKKSEKKTSNENLEDIIKPIVISCLSDKTLFLQNAQGELEEIGKLSEEKLDFIRKQITRELRKKREEIPEIKKIFSGKGLKKEYSNLVNNYIAEEQDGIIKPELKILNFQDGFKLDTADEKLIWSKDNPCNLFHLHGAYHLIEDEKNIQKMSSNDYNGMLENIEDYLNKGNTPFTILDGTASDKLNKIQNNNYLRFCLDNFKNISGTLVTLGVSFADNDSHILEAIVNNDKLEKIYLGFRNEEEIKRKKEALKTKLKDKFDKVIFYYYDGMFKVEQGNSKKDVAND